MHGAWQLELLRQRDHMQFALRAAYEDRDTACARVAEAQRDGDPRKIAAAHTALEAALDAALRSAVACDQVRGTLRAELDLPGRACTQRVAASLAGPPRQDGAAITAEPRQAPDPPGREPRPALAPPQRQRRRLSWLRSLRMRWIAGLDQP